MSEGPSTGTGMFGGVFGRIVGRKPAGIQIMRDTNEQAQLVMLG